VAVLGAARVLKDAALQALAAGWALFRPLLGIDVVTRLIRTGAGIGATGFARTDHGVPRCPPTTVCRRTAGAIEGRARHNGGWLKAIIGTLALLAPSSIRCLDLVSTLQCEGASQRKPSEESGKAPPGGACRDGANKALETISIHLTTPSLSVMSTTTQCATIMTKRQVGGIGKTTYFLR
jgi:hypothetical protein